jgi:hypothetical protein
LQVSEAACRNNSGVRQRREPAGLIVRRDPGPKGEPTGLLAAATTDVVKHVCQKAPLTENEQWCQISSGKISGSWESGGSTQASDITSRARSE